jgi:hypothetical protein
MKKRNKGSEATGSEPSPLIEGIRIPLGCVIGSKTFERVFVSVPITGRKADFLLRALALKARTSPHKINYLESSPLQLLSSFIKLLQLFVLYRTTVLSRTVV